MSLCKVSSPDLLGDVLTGDYFSVYKDRDSHYWVFSNKFPKSSYNGPYISVFDARRIMIDADQRMRYLVHKGLFYYE